MLLGTSGTSIYGVQSYNMTESLVANFKGADVLKLIIKMLQIVIDNVKKSHSIGISSYKSQLKCMKN